MFPIPKIDDMFQELDSLGFDNLQIEVNIGFAYVIAFDKKLGNWIKNQSSNIEIAVFGLIEVAKAYNCFSEETKLKIKQEQVQIYGERN